MPERPHLPPGAAWFDELLARCAAIHISDLTLETQQDESLSATIRRDGLRVAIDHCSAHDAGNAIARCKALAGLPGYIHDQAQDGRIDGTAYGIAGDCRVAIIPTVHGARVAIRLPALGSLPEPHELGLPASAHTALQQALAQPDGLILICGPTGAGKTTTMHSYCRALARDNPERALLSVEDPVERRLEGIAQIDVSRGPLGFTDALRASLRQDVDVLFIGEIRDQESAVIAVRAALAGHLVISSVHTPRANEAVSRLIEMGVDADILLASLRCVIAQRLLRRQHGGRQAVCDVITATDSVRACWRQRSPAPLDADMDVQARDLYQAGATTATELERVLGLKP